MARHTKIRSSSRAEPKNARSWLCVWYRTRLWPQSISKRIHLPISSVSCSMLNVYLHICQLADAANTSEDARKEAKIKEESCIEDNCCVRHSNPLKSTIWLWNCQNKELYVSVHTMFFSARRPSQAATMFSRCVCVCTLCNKDVSSSHAAESYTPCSFYSSPLSLTRSTSARPLSITFLSSLFPQNKKKRKKKRKNDKEDTKKSTSALNKFNESFSFVRLMYLAYGKHWRWWPYVCARLWANIANALPEGCAAHKLLMPNAAGHAQYALDGAVINICATYESLLLFESQSQVFSFLLRFEFCLFLSFLHLRFHLIIFVFSSSHFSFLSIQNRWIALFSLHSGQIEWEMLSKYELLKNCIVDSILNYL